MIIFIDSYSIESTTAGTHLLPNTYEMWDFRCLCRRFNYLIDEGVDCGKGLNMMVSLLHDFLYTYAVQPTHADNCVSQNKNNILIWVRYIMILILFNRHSLLLVSTLESNGGA